MSKFSLDVLNRCVFPHFISNDPDIVVGAVFGEDVAVTRISDGYLVSHVDPIVGAVNDIGWLAVHVACNDVATSGARPRWIQLLVLVPQKDDEALLEKIMGDVERAAGEIGVSVIGGHTGYSNSLSRPLVAVTALGVLSNREPILTRGAQPGDHIIVTKGIALEGTAILANDFTQTAIRLGLSGQDIDDARQLMKQVSVIPEANILGAHGATAMHDVTRGGLMETLLEVAELSHVGLQVDDDLIPIPKIVARFSDAFQFDPMKMISSGTLVATVSPSHIGEANGCLRESGILFADIGRVVQGNGLQIVRNSQTFTFNDVRPEDDELARMWVVFASDASPS